MKHYSKSNREEFFKTYINEFGNKCMICGNISRVVIDHNHSSGEIRGILCYTHNTGLGMFQDNPETLRAAATYLETHGYMTSPKPLERKTHIHVQPLLDNLMLDTSFENDTARAAVLAASTGLKIGTARVRVCRARKKLAVN